MFRTVVVAFVLTVTLVPSLPLTGATDSCGGQTAHVGGEPSVSDFHSPHHFDCCHDLTVIPLAAGTSTYYVNPRPPVDHDITDEPHPRVDFVTGATSSQPLARINPWLYAIENSGTTGIPAAVLGPKGPVDMGSSDVAVRSTTTVWLYQESNTVPGLQTGGSSLVGEDTCHDPTYEFSDTLVL